MRCFCRSECSSLKILWEEVLMKWKCLHGVLRSNKGCSYDNENNEIAKIKLFSLFLYILCYYHYAFLSISISFFFFISNYLFYNFLENYLPLLWPQIQPKTIQEPMWRFLKWMETLISTVVIKICSFKQKRLNKYILL